MTANVDIYLYVCHSNDPHVRYLRIFMYLRVCLCASDTKSEYQQKLCRLCQNISKTDTLFCYQGSTSGSS